MNIPIATPALIGNEKKYVIDCLDSNWISSHGKYIKKFEEEFAKFCGVKYALSCFNGTVALHLALLALGVKEKDEILIPTLTYVATANAVRYCGAIPVFVDSEHHTWNIDPSDIEKRITKKTKGIIIVHLYGHPVNFDPIHAIAKKYNLFIVEDAAEAHGALYKNKRVGSLGNIATFSFFGNKVITTGEGGMVVTNNKKLAKKMYQLKTQGVDTKRRYWFPIIGYNYRMTNIQAAIGLAQLENISWHLEKRKTVAQWYNAHLSSLTPYVELPFEQPWAVHSFWMYSILLKNTVKHLRDTVMHILQEKGIETRPIFYPITNMPPYNKYEGNFPVAKKIASRGISLPTHAKLTEKNIKYISDSLKKILIK